MFKSTVLSACTILGKQLLSYKYKSSDLALYSSNKQCIVNGRNAMAAHSWDFFYKPKLLGPMPAFKRIVMYHFIQHYMKKKIIIIV